MAGLKLTKARLKETIHTFFGGDLTKLAFSIPPLLRHKIPPKGIISSFKIGPKNLGRGWPPPPISIRESTFPNTAQHLTFYNRLSHALGPAGSPTPCIPADSNRVTPIGPQRESKPFCWPRPLRSPARAGVWWQCHFLGGLQEPGQVACFLIHLQQSHHYACANFCGTRLPN